MSDLAKAYIDLISELVPKVPECASLRIIVTQGGKNTIIDEA